MPNNSHPFQQADLIIHGHVHGVSFRVYVRHWALALGLTGFVQNQPDGTVHVLAQGPRLQLDQLIDKCYAGPKHSAVSHIITHYSPGTAKYHSFTIKY